MTKGLHVSIITPTLNSAAFVADNIKSVKGQTYKDIEHVFIDGGSKDSTLEIIRRLDPDAKVISEPDKGISDAFNKGLRLATGDIIAVLNSDDYYAGSGVIERVAEVMEREKDIGMLYAKVRFVNPEDGSTRVEIGEPYTGQLMFSTPHQAMFARREVYEKTGGFSLEYRLAMDLDFFLKAAASCRIYFMDEVLAIMRWGGLGSRNVYLGHREVYRALRSNGTAFLPAFAALCCMYFVTAAGSVVTAVGLGGIVRRLRKGAGS